MKDIRQYRVFPSNLNLIEAFTSLFGVLSDSNYKEITRSWFVSISCVKYCIESGTDRRHIIVSSHKEFLKKLCNIQPLSIDIHSHWRSRNEYITLIITITSSYIIVTFEGDNETTLSGLHAQFIRIFQIPSDLLFDHKNINSLNFKKTVFIAHRFDDDGKYIASQISRFLHELGFYVLEGEGYEARDIPSKVRERIECQDIFICIVTPGDPSWILSEAVLANTKKKCVIIMCQEGVEFNKGIIGNDYEHMVFRKDAVEKSYIDLLHVLPI